uniref:DUF834 domain-containing protein n=1 Tax=Oryza brachyantha TaxID=4533 RepID=J3NBQ2_ORYBR
MRGGSQRGQLTWIGRPRWSDAPRRGGGGEVAGEQLELWAGQGGEGGWLALVPMEEEEEEERWERTSLTGEEDEEVAAAASLEAAARAMAAGRNPTSLGKKESERSAGPLPR